MKSNEIGAIIIFILTTEEIKSQGGKINDSRTCNNSIAVLLLKPNHFWLPGLWFSSVQSLSHVPPLCDPINHSTPGLPVHHQLPESTHTHVHRVSEPIQPSYPLSSPSSPALNLSQHQGLFKWVSSLHQVAKSIGVSASTSVLPLKTQDWSPLGWTGWISLQSKGLSKSSPTP